VPTGAILLQSSKYFGEISTASMPAWVATLIIVAVVAVLALAILAARRGAAGGPASPERIRRSFHRTARGLGLSRQQSAELERLVRACKVRDPLLVFTNEGLLDDVLKRGVYALESPQNKDPDKNAKLRSIFLTKQILENAKRAGGGLKSTASLAAGLTLTVVPAQGGRYEVRLVANTKNVLAVSTPRSEGGREERWAKGTQCVVSFVRGGGEAYSFATRVVGHGNMRGSSCLLLQHGKTSAKEQQRRSRRRELSRPCFVYPVRITEVKSGRKMERKAVVLENLKTIGTVIDISGGGCSVRCREPLKRGTLVKVDLSLGHRDSVAAYGKIQRLRPEAGGGTMHIMWTRLSAAALNRIYSYVYDYTAMG